MTDYDTDGNDSGGKPWRDEETLRKLREGQGMAFYEMADVLGCSRSTVSTWVKKLEVGENHECPTCAESGFNSRRALGEHHSAAHDMSLIEYERKNEGEYECPTCEDRFSTEKAMKLHHAHSHGESISYITTSCSHCGSAVEIYPSHEREHNFCGRECQGKWNSEKFSGENSPVWKERQTYVCQQCGVEFKRKEAVAKQSVRDFCCRKCWDDWRSENRTGEDGYNWKGGPTICECEQCGDNVERTRYDLERSNNIFCSSECLSEWKSENIRGENHHCWDGGHDGYYGENWDKQSEFARERDGYQCQTCGVHQDQHSRKLHVHHKTPKSNFKCEDGRIDYERANQLDNLITLCERCHPKVEKMAPLFPIISD